MRVSVRCTSIADEGFAFGHDALSKSGTLPFAHYGQRLDPPAPILADRFRPVVVRFKRNRNDSHYAIFDMQSEQLPFTLALGENVLGERPQPLADALYIKPAVHAHVDGVSGINFVAADLAKESAQIRIISPTIEVRRSGRSTARVSDRLVGLFFISR